jgi:hypothetical protein
MVITPSSITPAPSGDGDAGPCPELAARVLSGPGLWLDWLGELDRQSLLEQLLAGDVIARALADAPHSHAYDRTLTGKMTVICVLVACLFPGAGYDTVLATAFGLPGLCLKPGTEVPCGPAFSKARKLLGEQVMKRLFELDAARGDAEPGIGSLWKGMEVTALDGTTMELFRNDVLADAFGVPADGARPLLRIAAHVRTRETSRVALRIRECAGQGQCRRVRRQGLEPRTRGLRVCCSAAEGIGGQDVEAAVTDESRGVGHAIEDELDAGTDLLRCAAPGGPGRAGVGGVAASLGAMRSLAIGRCRGTRLRARSGAVDHRCPGQW